MGAANLLRGIRRGISIRLGLRPDIASVPDTGFNTDGT